MIRNRTRRGSRSAPPRSWQAPGRLRIARRLIPVALAMLVGLVSDGAPTAIAHVIMGTKSLHLRVAESDRVVRGRVLDPAIRFVTPDGRSQRDLVEIQVLETLKGSEPTDRLRIVQDGHDVARYRPGEEALFFLTPIEESRELRSLAAPGGPAFVSSQEHDERLSLEPPHGPVLLSAVRAFAASEKAETVATRIALIRGATLDLLTSGDPRLGAAALSSLVVSPDAELVRPDDLPRLLALLSDDAVSIGLRAGILSELQRRNLVEGPPQWRSLLERASREDLPTAMRAAGSHPSGPVRDFLRARLTDPDEAPTIAAEAALALGASRDPSLVPLLAKAIEREHARVRNAAIRGLGRIGGLEARQALEAVARTHPDPQTRRRAAARARSLASRSAPLDPARRTDRASR